MSEHGVHRVVVLHAGFPADVKTRIVLRHMQETKYKTADSVVYILGKRLFVPRLDNAGH